MTDVEAMQISAERSENDQARLLETATAQFDR
jgi:hypothetical protein